MDYNSSILNINQVLMCFLWKQINDTDNKNVGLKIDIKI